MADTSIAFSVLDQNLKDVIKDDLNEFYASVDTCCIEFSWIYPKIHRSFIHSLAKEKGFQSITKHISKGRKKVIVYKNVCKEFIKEKATFHLTDTSKEKINDFLKNSYRNTFASNSNCYPPRVSLYRFCFGTSHYNLMTIPPVPSKLTDRKCMPIYQYKDLILKTIKSSQVTVVVGDAGYGKSTQIPQFIMEEASAMKTYCRIISSQNKRISVINNTEKVSLQRGEKEGSTVGYQLHLENLTNPTLNLLFTTADFFLRCLMGSSIEELFLDITHIILDDFHERDMCYDLLLAKIKEVLNKNVKLRVIILTCPTDINLIRKFFEFPSVIELKSQMKEVKVYFSNEIPFIQNYEVESLQRMSNQNMNSHQQLFVDNLLLNYFNYGDSKFFDLIISAIENSNVPVNAQHSIFMINALMCAARHNHLGHAMKLLYFGIDPNATDKNNMTAYDWALSSNNTTCATFLREIHLKNLFTNVTETFIDAPIFGKLLAVNSIKRNLINHNFLSEFVKFIHMNNGEGSVVVFLPEYEDLLRQKFILNETLLKDKIEDFSIHIFDDNIQKPEFDEVLSFVVPGSPRKIILTTDRVKSVKKLLDVIVVVDTGIQNFKKGTIEWISKEIANKRSLVAARQGTNGCCYRLYSKKIYENMQKSEETQLSDSILQKMCLYAKILTPSQTIGNFMSKLIRVPCQHRIEKCVKFLKNFGALDDNENITIIGIRLVEIPLDIKLGKILLFSIILQCLDPVLTIVSSLTSKALTEMFFGDNYNSIAQEGINLKRDLAQGTNCDHLVLLKVFQNWQNETTDEMRLYKNDEEKFILNGLLEQIYHTRVQTVGMLRAIGLIQSQGYKNMTTLNKNSHNWAIVKACIFGGLYSNICRVDITDSLIKSEKDDFILLHPSSILNYAEWIMYQDYDKIEKFRNIICNTAITPITVTLFGGNMRLSENNVSLLTEIESDSESEVLPEKLKTGLAEYVVDDWISFILKKDDARLLYSLRKKFFDLFFEMMQTREYNHQKTRQYAGFLQNSSVSEVIAEVLLTEDCTHNFLIPNNIGVRPKALTKKVNFKNVPKEDGYPVVATSSFTQTMEGNQYQTLQSINDVYLILRVNTHDWIQEGFYEEFKYENKAFWNYLSTLTDHRIFLNIFIFLFSGDTFYGVTKLNFVSNKWFIKVLVQKKVQFDVLKLLYTMSGKVFNECCSFAELPKDISKSFLKNFRQ